MRKLNKKVVAEAMKNSKTDLSFLDDIDEYIGFTSKPTVTKIVGGWEKAASLAATRYWTSAESYVDSKTVVANQIVNQEELDIFMEQL